jgi:hypothetical protein
VVVDGEELLARPLHERRDRLANLLRVCMSADGVALVEVEGFDVVFLAGAGNPPDHHDGCPGICQDFLDTELSVVL